MASRISGAVQSAPHSWSFSTWPVHVWPNSSDKAKYTARAFRNELLNAGAISRAGRELIFNGVGYTRFLQKLSAKAAPYGFEVPANRKRVASFTPDAAA